MFNVSLREYFSVLNVFIVYIHNTVVFKLLPHVYSYMFSTMHPPMRVEPLSRVPSFCRRLFFTKIFLLKGPCFCIIVQELALTEEAMGDVVKAEEYFRKAGIADRLKSRTKRKVFESRKAAPKVKVPLKSRIDATQKPSSRSQSTTPGWRRQVPAATKTGVR